MAKKHELLGKEKDVTFKHWKSSSKTYRDNTKSGFMGSKWQAHHVIPGTSMEQSLEKFLEKKHVGYKRALANFTKWDLNEEYNMLGLPTEATYRNAFRRDRPTGLPLLTPALLKKPMDITQQPVLPIHNPPSWGHPAFNKDVKAALDDVWGAINPKPKEHEPTSAPDLRQAIQNISDRFRGRLQKKSKQTKKDWQAKEFDQFCMV